MVPALEVADIFRRHGEAFRQARAGHLGGIERRVMGAITACRTAPVPEVLPLHDAEAWPSDCALRLAEIARFANQPTLNGPGQCGASDVVRLEGIL